MKFRLNGRPVEIEKTDRNSDGSKFIVKAGFLDGDLEDLNDNELDELQNWYDDCMELNGLWG